MRTRKIKNAIGLAADLARGALLILAGTAMIVGGSMGIVYY